MELSLHANATTTPKTRAYIQRSRKSVAELATELGVSETTIYRWRDRTTVEDRSHRPKNLVTSLSAVEERAVCELRTSLQLPLDDIVEVMQRCINAKLSRSAIHRCLQRNGISRLAKPDKPKVGIFETASIGFIHIDVKYLPSLQRRTSYAFVAIDRATRYVFVEIHSRRDGATATGFLERFLADFPHQVHTILTDNGAEFTDRFAVDKKNKPPGKPSGDHPFDRLCKQRGIQHRLTKPYHPQTNGLVERFNRRIAEAIGREQKRGSARRTFIDHADRDAFIAKFVHDYNRTRLKCLGYQAPIQAVAKLTGLNTFAGTTSSMGVALSSPIRAPDYVHQLGDLAPLVGLVAGRDRMLDAMRHMIAQHLFLDAAQRRARGRDLRHHVDAIAVVLDHGGQSADLTFDPFEPF
ncbi:transposase-like protein [Bradyrhizobium sp. USDA 4506]